MKLINAVKENRPYKYKSKPDEPAHALFVLCKLILQTRMRSHPGG